MKQLYIKSARKIIQNKKELEEKLRVKIIVNGTIITILGEEINKYFAEKVLMAMDFPFLVEDALLLKSEEYILEVLCIKDYTKRHDLNVIKGRLIGTKRKTLRTLETLTNSIMAVKDNNIAIIAPVKEMKDARQAVISLIQGSKQGNVYAHLEKGKKKKKTQ